MTQIEKLLSEGEVEPAVREVLRRALFIALRANPGPHHTTAGTFRYRLKQAAGVIDDYISGYYEE